MTLYIIKNKCHIEIAQVIEQLNISAMYSILVIES